MPFFDSTRWSSVVDSENSTAKTGCNRLQRVLEKAKKAILVPRQKEIRTPAPAPRRDSYAVHPQAHIRHTPQRKDDIARGLSVKSSNAASLLRLIKERTEKQNTRAKSASAVIAEGNDKMPFLRKAVPTLSPSSSTRASQQVKGPPARLNMALLSREARLGFTRHENHEDTAAALYSSPLSSPTWSTQSSEGSQETLVHSSFKSSRSSSSSKQAEFKAVSEAHNRLSKDAWQSYRHDIQEADTEAAAADWRSFLEKLCETHETQTAGLRAQIDNVQKSHEVDLASQRHLHNAEVQATRNRTDEIAQMLQQREEKLDLVVKKSAEIEEEVERTRQERDFSKSQIVLWQTQTSEAMDIGSELKARLEAIETERDFLRSRGHAATILQLRSENSRLLIANEKLINEYSALNRTQEYARQVHLRDEQEIKTLQNQIKAAAIKVGFLARVNLGHNIVNEDRPELSAHLDGLLKRKDEEYGKLVERLNQCNAIAMEEQKMRAVDREHADGVRRTLKQEISYFEEKFESLETSRNNLQMQRERLSLTLAGRISEDDVVQSLMNERDVYRKDRDRLIEMVHSREVRVAETMGQIAPLKVKIIELEHALEATTPMIEELQADVNGLELRNENFRLDVETQNSELDFKNRELQESLSQKTQQLEELYRSSLTTPIAQQLAAMQGNEIAGLKEQLQKVVNEKNYWYNRATEQGEDFCHVFNADLVVDVESEEMRYRLRHAERTAAELTQLVREAGIWHNMPCGMDPRHAELDEAERQLQQYARQSAA